jgi:hypothetical protein
LTGRKNALPEDTQRMTSLRAHSAINIIAAITKLGDGKIHMAPLPAN